MAVLLLLVLYLIVPSLCFASRGINDQYNNDDNDVDNIQPQHLITTPTELLDDELMSSMLLSFGDDVDNDHQETEGASNAENHDGSELQQQLRSLHSRGRFGYYGGGRGRGSSMGGGRSGYNRRRGYDDFEDPVGMVTVKSGNSFDDTYTNLLNALNGNDAITVMAEIDHSAAASSVNSTLKPNRLVVFGNPNLGTPVMEANQLVGLDLPQKMLVYEEEGNSTDVYVGYNPPDYLKARYSGIDNVSTLDTINGALANFASIATGVPAENITATATLDDDEARFIRRSRSGIICMISDSDFDTTFDRLNDAINASAANVAFIVDHQMNAPNTSSLEPTSVVVFGNPNLGTPLMVESATTGLDLPLKILVTKSTITRGWGWAKRNATIVKVTTNSLSFLAGRHGLSDTTIEPLVDPLRNFLRAAARGGD